MPYIAKDGIFDCDRLCDPANGYSVSCSNICPGYFQSTTLLTPVSKKESVDPDLRMLVNFSVFILLAGVIILLVIAGCHYKRHIYELVIKLCCTFNTKVGDKSNKHKDTQTITKSNNTETSTIPESDNLLTSVDASDSSRHKMLDEEAQNRLNVTVRDDDGTNSTGNTPDRSGESPGRRTGQYFDDQEIQKAKGSTVFNMDETYEKKGLGVNNDNSQNMVNTDWCGSTKPLDQSLPNAGRSSTGSPNHAIQETNHSVDDMSRDNAESRDHYSIIIEDSHDVTIGKNLDNHQRRYSSESRRSMNTTRL